MYRKHLSTILTVIVLPLLLLASAGISSAHDTGYPHTHDGGDESDVKGFAVNSPDTVTGAEHSHGMPLIVVIVPFGGDSSGLHWLLHHISGQDYHDLSDWNHQHMHWHGIAHTHDSDFGDQGGDPSVPLTQEY